MVEQPGGKVIICVLATGPFAGTPAPTGRKRLQPRTGRHRQPGKKATDQGDGRDRRRWVSCVRVALVAQLDRVLPSEGRGRGFESRRVRHIKKPWACARGFFICATCRVSGTPVPLAIDVSVGVLPLLQRVPHNNPWRRNARNHAPEKTHRHHPVAGQHRPVHPTGPGQPHSATGRGNRQNLRRQRPA